MSSGFENSVLLEQNSTGVRLQRPIPLMTADSLQLLQHTSLSGFSTCTALAIRAYYANGTLPAAGTICQTDTKMFENPANSSAQGGVTFPKRSLLEYGDRSLAEAVRALRESDFMARNSWIGKMRRVKRSLKLL